MSGFVSVHPLEPAADPASGPCFDDERVQRFRDRWSLVTALGEPGEFATQPDEYGAVLAVIADSHGFSAQRPGRTGYAMAIDWMLSVGGTIVDNNAAFVSADPRWLEIDARELSLPVFVVADAAAAHTALDFETAPAGVWDVREGFHAVPITVHRIFGHAPRIVWHGHTIIFDDDVHIETPEHTLRFWGRAPMRVEHGRTYLADDWTVRPADDRLAATRGDRTCVIARTADGPRFEPESDPTAD